MNVVSNVRADEPGDRPVSGVQATGPTVLRIGLGARLRHKREVAGLTREEAGDAIRGSAAKISRLELGRVGFKERDVSDLLTRYGVRRRRTSGPSSSPSLGRANAPGWWHRYSDLLPSWFETYLGMEQAASMIRHVRAAVRARTAADPALRPRRHPARHSDPAEVERRVELRMRRQAILSAPGRPHPVGRRRRGGPAAQPRGRRAAARAARPAHRAEPAAQRRRCRSRRCATAGTPPRAARSPSCGSAEPDLPDIVYLEQLTSALYLDKRVDVDHYAMVMDRLCAQVEPPDRTEATLMTIREEL